MIDDDHSLARVGIGVDAHLAGTVSAAEDVMVVGEGASVQIEEEARVLVVPYSAYHLLGCSIGYVVERCGSNHCKDEMRKLFLIVAYTLAVSVCRGPCGYVAVDVGFAVPYPRASVHLHLSVTKDVGIGAIAVCVLASEHLVCCFLLVVDAHVAISAAVDAVAEHAALDVHERVAVNRAVGTAAVDVAPYVWHDVVLVCIVAWLAVGDVYKGVAVDASYVFIMVSLCLRQTLATAIHIAEYGAAGDVDERAVAHSLIADECAVGLIECCYAAKRVG